MRSDDKVGQSCFSMIRINWGDVRRWNGHGEDDWQLESAWWWALLLFIDCE